MSLKPQCRNCAMYTPQYYDGQQQPIGRCMHISFFKVGVARFDEAQKIEIIHPKSVERTPKEEIDALHEQGYLYHDLVDIKMHRGRVCEHWTSPLDYAEKILAHHGESMDYILSFEGLPKVLKDWFEQGMPLVEREYPKLNRISTQEYIHKGAPEEVYTGAENCISCRFYKQDLDANGSPIVFRGTCQKNVLADAGVFGLSESSETPRTYSFLSCQAHQNDDSYNTREEPTELPSRLLIFIETNPLNLSAQNFQDMLRFPAVTRSREVEQAEYDAMMATDLTQHLRERHRQIDFNQFYADFALGPVADFFSKGIKSGTMEVKKEWGGMMHYKQAEDVLFAPREDSAAAEEAALVEFGSSQVPQNAFIPSD